MRSCVHCGSPVVLPVYLDTDVAHGNPFCCWGCLTVFEALHSKGLGEFYDIKKRVGNLRSRAPVSPRPAHYEYLDDPKFLEHYADGPTLEFYLEGIHCLGCLWLIEKLPDYCPGVARSKLDLERSVVTVTLDPGGRFSSCARELMLLGYTPHPVKRSEDVRLHRTREERAMLVRIGVAGAAAGNIMLYAVSLYGGADGGYGRLFNLLTVALGIPALTYSAWPFYQSAMSALRSRVLSIDIPISIALIVGLVMGVRNALIGVDENYFDSLSTLVFLLLLSRFFLRKLQQNGLTPTDLHFFHHQEGVQRVDADGVFRAVHPELLRSGDVIRVGEGEILPVDGEVAQGHSFVNAGLLTGESAPVEVVEGSCVYAGTQNLDGQLLVRVQKAAQETRLGQLLLSVERGWALKAPIVTLTAKVSQYFTFVVFAIALFLAWSRWNALGPEGALELAITLLIVTCPCALALATPLTFIRALSLAARHGVIIKSDEVVERLAQCRTVILDKTGTVTHGQIRIRDFSQLAPTEHRIHDVILSLERDSRHPVGRALREYALACGAKVLPLTDRRELLGQGVEGRIGAVRYHIGRGTVRANETIVACFRSDDELRGEAAPAVRSLRSLGLEPLLLSGDHAESVEAIARDLGLGRSEWIAEASPEEKAAHAVKRNKALMVGDGANDAVALRQAYVGVAVAGAMDLALRAADVYLTVPGTAPVVQLIELSRETMKLVWRNLVLSLLYNSASVVAVFTGHITPLVAAIIMPLSSLTVLLSTLWGTKKMRQLWK